MSEPTGIEDETLSILMNGEMRLEGQFTRGSNYTFFASVTSNSKTLSVVYKPMRGEIPLWDFPRGTLAKRETAAYRFSAFLGWDLVPPTVYRRRKAPLGMGSVQLYIDHKPNYHYFNLSTSDKSRLAVVVLFDLLINNADRKGSHVIFDLDGRLWCIDHGVCFHTDEKLRTVIWDFAGQPMPDSLLKDIQRLGINLGLQESQEYRSLREMLRPMEIKALQSRCLAYSQQAVFPLPSPHYRPYPYPPL